jgi:hypothetical protein
MSAWINPRPPPNLSTADSAVALTSFRRTGLGLEQGKEWQLARLSVRISRSGKPDPMSPDQSGHDNRSEPPV